MIASPSRVAIGFSKTVSFAGLQGVPPYAFSLQPGGSGGVIDSASGVYTSPSNKGNDTVIVTDSNGDQAFSSVQILTPMQLLCDVLATELEMDPARVWVYDQKIMEPTDEAMYIVVSVLDLKPFANTKNMQSDGTVLQTSNWRAMLSVDIKSRGPEARDRKEEVLMALNGPYSEQQQNANTIRIFPLTNKFVSLGGLDGAAIPYRFNMSVALQYFVEKTQPVNYYDDFVDAALLTEP